MNIDQMKSSLSMHDLFFSKCLIEREPKIENGELNVNLKKKIEMIKEHEFFVTLNLSIDKTDLHLEIIANATFDSEDDGKSNEEVLIQNNTIAIMYPFVRSQVTLMTSQPGMAPIVLPPINVSKLQ